jgi:hypothetical protein
VPSEPSTSQTSVWCESELLSSKVCGCHQGRHCRGELRHWRLSLSGLIPEPGESGTDQWQDFLAYEQAALQVDMNCRGQQHAQAMALLDPQLDQFEKEHADDISRLRTEWQQLVVQASAAGWNADGASQDH